MENDYVCPKCHNVFPSANRLLHDFRCTKENPMPLDQSRQIKINENNNPNEINNNSNYNNEENSPKIEEQNQNFKFNSEFQIPQNNDYFPNFFSCDLCGLVLPETSKSDHFLCHNIEKKEKELLNKNILNLQNINIQEQKQIEEQIRIETQKKIKQQKKLQDQIKKKNLEKQRKQIKMIQEQRKIEEQIKKQNEMRRQRERLINNQQNQNLRINYLNRNTFFQPVQPNYNHPTDQNILNALPENKLDDVTKLDNEKKNCSICLEDFKNGDKTTSLPCIHFFHTFCIKNWLNTQNTCPICKYKLTRNNVH